MIDLHTSVRLQGMKAPVRSDQFSDVGDPGSPAQPHLPKAPVSRYTVIDLFSGAGGFSYGFHAHPRFQVVAAVDAQICKPSDDAGNLECNLTYQANMGIKPANIDLANCSAEGLANELERTSGTRSPDILIVCPPCTGLTRTVPKNHLIDDPRNELIDRAVSFVAAMRPRVMLMENARELILGKHSHHYSRVKAGLEALGYRVHGDVYRFDRFGLPQLRERAIIIAAAPGIDLRTLSDLWDGAHVSPTATTVRRALTGCLPLAAGQASSKDPVHFSPALALPVTRARIERIPKNGGSWRDLLNTEHEHLLIPSMLAAAATGKLNAHGDVYGRMRWDQPSPTIKRECAHVGNGRYSHPEQDRLCSAREMAILQGFPRSYKFQSKNKGNIYRHIGNAVPPLVAHQLAWVCLWMLTGQRPDVRQVILPECHLTPDDVVCVGPSATGHSSHEVDIVEADATSLS